MRSIGGRAGAFGLAAVTATTVMASLGATPVSAQEPPACTTSWAAAVDGDWDDPARWTAGVPDATDVACLEAAGTYTVTLDVHGVAQHARVGSGATLVLIDDASLDATLVNGGTVDLGDDGFITGTTFTQQAGGRLQVTVDALHPAHSSFADVEWAGTLQVTTVDPLPWNRTYGLLLDGGGFGQADPGTPLAFEQVGESEVQARLGAGGLTLRTARSPEHRTALGTYGALDPVEINSPAYSADVARLEDGRVTPARLARELSLSDPHRALLVDELYRSILEREPDRTGRDLWVRQIRLGRRTVTTVAASMYGSAEHGAASPDTAHWVGRVYASVLGRSPSDPDRAFWAAQADQLGRGTAANRLLQTPESRRRRVGPLFERTLLRAPGAGERAYWADRLLAEGDSAVLAALTASAEAQALFQQRYAF